MNPDMLERAKSGNPLVVVSLGAGTQSSRVAVEGARGVYGKVPDAAIFADTGAEPQAVYDYLEILEDLLPYPVYRVQEGNGLTESILESATPNENGDFVGRFAGAPFYTTGGDREGMLRRQCTREFKIAPITKKIRELLGLEPRERAPLGPDGKPYILCEQWIGISWDEKQRMKDPRERWLRHRWPLIERQISRMQCIEWLVRQNLPEPVKSACSYCPYRTNAEWRDLKANHPDAWDEAVRMDEAVREGVRGTTEQLYVHQSLVPLADVDLADPGHQQISFLDECDGMCGV